MARGKAATNGTRIGPTVNADDRAHDLTGEITRARFPGYRRRVAAATRHADSARLEVDRGEAPSNLTGVVVTGLKWTTLRHVVAEGTRIALTLVLARLLTPSDYGIASMALVTTAFVMIFADPALGSALIQRPVIDERDRSTVFWTSAALGVLLTVVGVACAGLVADLFGEPEVKNLFVVTSFTFTVVALATVPRSLLARRLAYRALELREIVSIVIGALVALTVALAGYGPWAIVANMVTYSIISTLLSWSLARWWPRLTYSKASLRNLGGFSAKVFTASLISWGNVNLDKVLVGRVLGAASLGAYSLAFNVMFMPMTRITRPIQQVLSPAYSRIQHDTARLQTAWLRSKRLSVAITSPIFLGLLVGAPDLVPFAFGSNWNAAIVPLQLLCVGGIAVSLGTFNWPVLQATGATGTLLRLNILTSAVTWTSIVVGLPWGITGVAAFYAAARWLLVVPETWITARAVGFDFRASLRAGFESVPFATAAAVAALGVRMGLTEMGTAPALRLLAVGTVTIVVYVGLLALVRRSLLVEVRGALRRRDRGNERCRSGGPGKHCVAWKRPPRERLMCTALEPAPGRTIVLLVVRAHGRHWAWRRLAGARQRPDRSRTACGWTRRRASTRLVRDVRISACGSLRGGICSGFRRGCDSGIELAGRACVLRSSMARRPFRCATGRPRAAGRT